MGATWIGGTANLVAVSRAIAAEPDVVSLALLTDTVCYTAWVLLLFGIVPLAERFNRWARAVPANDPAGHAGPVAATGRLVPGDVLVWLGLVKPEEAEGEAEKEANLIFFAMIEDG